MIQKDQCSENVNAEKQKNKAEESSEQESDSMESKQLQQME